MNINCLFNDYNNVEIFEKCNILFFRFISGNSVLCSGGDYEIDGLESSGFAIMSDAVIEKILEKKD